MTKKKIKKKVKKVAKKVNSKKKIIKEKFVNVVICEYCKRRIMYREDCTSYYNSLTREKKLYHFKCSLRI